MWGGSTGTKLVNKVQIGEIGPNWITNDGGGAQHGAPDCLNNGGDICSQSVVRCSLSSLLPFLVLRTRGERVAYTQIGLVCRRYRTSQLHAALPHH